MHAVALAAECHAPCWWPYKPVCGADGKTYANECRAACKGVEVVSQGGCRVRTRNGWFGRKPCKWGAALWGLEIGVHNDCPSRPGG